MQRVFAYLAAFAGWMSLLVSAVSGLLATEFLGLNHTEGPLPPSTVYGIPEVIVLWTIVGVALVALLPIATALVSDAPSRTMYVVAAALAVTGIVLLPDELGRIHALTIFGGAASFALAGYLTAEPLIPAADPAPPDGEAAEDAALAPSPIAAPDPAAGPATPALATPALAASSSNAAPAAPDPHPAGPDEAGPAPRTRTRRRLRRGSGTLCPWCSAECRAGAASCDSCGAALVESPDMSDEAIPGLTVVSPELRDYADRAAHPAKKQRASLLSMMMGEKDDRLMDPEAAPAFAGASDAVKPPSDQVRLEMRRLALEIEAAHRAALQDAQATEGPDTPSPGA